MDDENDFLESSDCFREQIELFKKDLAAQKLSERTAKKHVENVDFYLHAFGVNYDQIHELKDGCYAIGFYLGDWYIDKCAWACKSDCKSQSVGIKKFYKCMLNHALVSKEDYQYLVNEINGNLEKWLDTIESYENWMMGNDDGDYDWYDDEEE